FSPWQARQAGMRSSSGCAAAGSAARAGSAAMNASVAATVMPRISTPSLGGRSSPSPPGHARVAVAHPVDGARVVGGDEQRAVLQDQGVDRPADIVVVLQEAGQERLPGLNRAVLVELHHDDVAADLLGLVPRAVAGDEDRVAVLLGEH